MKRYAVVEDQKVINVIIADEDFASEHGLIECPDGNPGWIYEGTTFSAPLRDITEEWVSARKIRDEYLVASDLNVLPDRWAAMSAEKQAEWSTYRQALRDIPSNFTDPADIQWPTKPE
jgi:hypothetical protein